jgi:hypothetical protein
MQVLCSLFYATILTAHLPIITSCSKESSDFQNPNWILEEASSQSSTGRRENGAICKTFRTSSRTAHFNVRLQNIEGNDKANKSRDVRSDNAACSTGRDSCRARRHPARAGGSTGGVGRGSSLDERHGVTDRAIDALDEGEGDGRFVDDAELAEAVVLGVEERRDVGGGVVHAEHDVRLAVPGHAVDDMCHGNPGVGEVGVIIGDGGFVDGAVHGHGPHAFVPVDMSIFIKSAKGLQILVVIER